YCSPEQPPPCTKTRSIRFGLPSPWISSPTLRAAASVNSREGASSEASAVLIGASLEGDATQVKNAILSSQCHRPSLAAGHPAPPSVAGRSGGSRTRQVS